VKTSLSHLIDLLRLYATVRTLLGISILCVAPLHAQETRATISGVTTDAQGGAIAGAVVVITNTEMNTSTRLVTNATGYYEARLLLPGHYQVAAEFPGFKRTLRSGLTVAASQEAEVNLQLEIGTLTETVAVTGETPLLDTSAVSAGRTLDRRSMVDLPAMSSNPVLFVKLTPGVQTTGTQPYVAQGFTGGTSNYRNPEGVGGNEWSIDGVTNNGGGRNIAATPNVDMLQEMRVETANFDASFGHGTGLSVAMMTKSGVNALHGTANWQHWQQRWNASGFFQKQNFHRQIAAARAAGDFAGADQLASRPIQPSGHSNAVTSTIGGPVVIPRVYDGRNKLFFFFNFSWEANLVPTDPDDAINYTIPTLANRQGDFSQLLNVDPRYQIYDPLTTRADPARPTHMIRLPFAGNVLPRNRMNNPLYQAYTGFLPRPNDDPLFPNLEPFNNYKAFQEPGHVHNKLFGNRIDYNHSDKHRFFGRWSWFHFIEKNGGWLYETFPGLQDDFKTRENLSATFDWTYAASARTVLNAQVGGTDFLESLPKPINAQYKPSSVGLPAYMDQKCGNDCALPIVDFTGYTSLGKPLANPVHWRQLSGKVNLTHIMGAHSLRAGFETRQHFRSNRAPGAAAGQFGFSNLYTRRADDTSVYPAGDLGLSWAAFALGIPSSMVVDTNDDYAAHNPYHSWYVQNSWRVNRSLTLNFGLRFEWEGGVTERYNRMITSFDPSAKLPITDAAQAAYAARALAEAPASAFLVRGGPNYASANGAPRTLFNAESLWLPRVSAAWQVRQNMVIRGGYGWFYDTLNVNVAGITQTGFSRSTSTIITNDFGQTWNVGNPGAAVSPLSDPFPVRSDGTRFDTPYGNRLGLMSVAGASYSYPLLDRKHPRVQRWRIGVQRQFGSSMVLEAAYVGSFGDRLDVNHNLASLPEQYWATGLVRNSALASNLNSNVPNPFYIDNFKSLQASDPLSWDRISKLSFFTSPTIQKNRLLRDFPNMTGVTRQNNPLGKSRNHQIEASLDKRFSKGFNFNFSFTASGVSEKLFLPNEYDRTPPQWITGANARPYRVAATGIYELPFGPGRAFWRSGFLKHVAGGWQISGTLESQPGIILSWGNLFYHGNLEDIKIANPTVERWFNVDAGFERNAARVPAAFHTRVFPQRIEGLRGDRFQLVNASLKRDIDFLEKYQFQLRLDAINLMNRSHLNIPNLTTTSTNFGKVTAAAEVVNRFIQLQARFRF